MALHHVKMQDGQALKGFKCRDFVYMCTTHIVLKYNKKWMDRDIKKKIDPMFENERFTKKLGERIAESNDRMDFETNSPSSTAIIRPV